jgi:hypothetical protein
MWSITPCYKYYLMYHTRLVCHLPCHTCCRISSAMSHSVIFCILVQILAIGILKLTNMLSVTVTIKSGQKRNSGNDEEKKVQLLKLTNVKSVTVTM